MFTCVVDGVPEGRVAWGRNNVAVILAVNKQPLPIPDFTLNVTYYNATAMRLDSTATSQSVPVQLKGSIGCSTDGLNFVELTINITGIIFIKLIL